MENKLLVALVDSLISDAIKKIQLREGPRGPRGLRGKDGNDFYLEDHKQELIDLILAHVPKTFELTEEQVSLLKGPQGQAGKDGIDGRDGKDGKNGRDFIFDEHEEIISEIIRDHSLTFDKLTSSQIESLRGPKGEKGEKGDSFSFEENKEGIDELVIAYLSKIQDVLKLKFEDLSEEEKLSLRGPRGQRGKPGRDFDLEEAIPEIEKAVEGKLEELSPSLKLKFEDLSEEEKLSLRGPRGQRGKPGKDFNLEESSPEIFRAVGEKLEELSPSLKLKFEDLSEEEKDSLKLKFDDLDPEEKMSLRGPRGQRGKIGMQGEQGPAGKDGKDGSVGPRGPIGLPGLAGRAGRDGEDGRDGQDAPRITDVRVEQYQREFNLIFGFDDGSEIKSEDIKIPKGDTTYYYPAGMGSSSGGGSGGSGADGKSAYEVALDNGFVGTEQDWLDSLKGEDGVSGLDGQNGIDGADGASAYEVALDNGFVGTEQDWLDSLKGDPGTGGSGSIEVQDEHNVVTTAATSFNFIGEGVKVRPRTYMSEWPSLSDVEPSLVDYPGASGNPPKVDVYIEPVQSFVVNGMPHTDFYILTQADMDAKRLTLSSEPFSPITLIPDGGIPQRNLIDYKYERVGNYIDWDGYGLDGYFAVGDYVEVSYTKKLSQEFERFVMTSDTINNSKKVYLTYLPISSITVRPDGGMFQRNTLDFQYNASDNSVSWATLGLDGFLEETDTLEITYFRG